MSILPVILRASLFGNILAGKGVARGGKEQLEQGRFLMLSRPLTNFGIQRFNQKKSYLQTITKGTTK